ncbi:hypothetical protein FS749_008552 [Ceratobasidium sp. UAMH 11750]|nr:hypothetical protein FS749_008552 [Ceratobasidium sp. UAMH 11750]
MFPGHPIGGRKLFKLARISSQPTTLAAITAPPDFTKSYPSHLVDGGFVHWNNVSLLNHHTPLSISQLDSRVQDSVSYSVSFPDVRWESIRATEGWAGLQHHVLLHATVRIDPSSFTGGLDNATPTYLLLSAIQCSHVAVLDMSLSPTVPRWHTGNIYAYPDAPIIRIPLFFNNSVTDHQHIPTSDGSLEGIYILRDEPKELDLLIGLDYEIRLFGDPLVSTNSTLPTILADLHVALEFPGDSSAYSLHHNTELAFQGDYLPAQLTPDTRKPESIRACAIIADPTTHIVPHFVNGWAYGDVIGVEITSCSHAAWTITGATVVPNQDELSNVDRDHGLSLDILDPVKFAPSQTRLITLKIRQTSPLPPSVRSFIVTLHIGSVLPLLAVERVQTLQTLVSVVNHDSLSKLETGIQHIIMSYTSVSGIPASAVLLPPNSTNFDVNLDTRILVAMHGAGVMHTSPFMLAALPRPRHTWVLVVQGLTPWGLDWREASRADVCSALRELVLRLAGTWNEEDYCTPHDTVTSVTRRADVGHIAIPVIAIGHSNGGQGALYLASQFPDSIPALIPAAGYTSARLYISTQHSRGSMFADAGLQSIIRASLQGQDGGIIAGNLVLNRVHLVHGGEDENVPVWHSRERMALVKSWNPDADISFTEVPGKPHFWPTVFQDEPVSSRIAELVASPYAVLSHKLNSFTFTVVWPSESGGMGGWRVRELAVPGRLARIRVHGTHVFTTNAYGLSINLSRAGLNHGWVDIDGQHIDHPDIPVVWLRRNMDSNWKVVEPFSPYPSGPLSRILTSPTTISIVIPGGPNAYYQSLALRLAHNAFTYLKLDCTIVEDHEVLSNQSSLAGSVVVIGGYQNKYGLRVRSSPLRALSDGSISISGVKFGRAGTGSLSLHKNHLYIDAVDEVGYEKALQAFPLRTGVPGPEWMILGEECEQKGYGGVYAAGFWNRQGEFSEVMSYFS